MQQRGVEGLRRKVVGLLAIGVLLLVPTSAVQAKATQTPYEFTVTDVSVGVPEKVWVSNGILHIRGQTVTTAITGDIVGTAITIRSVNVDLSTGSGEAWGTFARTVTWQGASGTFEGHFTAKITASSTIVKLVGQGGGDLDGLQNRDILTSAAPGVFEGEGIILNTKG
jgi:hypothetical protein